MPIELDVSDSKSTNSHPSKPLGSSDESGAEFVRELLAGEPTYAINFDRLQYDYKDNKYIIFEFLLCEEWQSSRGITPFTSHPKRYWSKNRMKFISLWKAAQKLESRLFLVNYAKKGTIHEDKVLIIEVIELNDNGIIREDITQMSRSAFAEWFRALNRRCAG